MNTLNKTNATQKRKENFIGGVLLFSLTTIVSLVICILTILVGYSGKFILGKIM